MARIGTAPRPLPLPPTNMRRLVGPTDDASFDNPTRERVYPMLPDHVYRGVFDFGCGCGRVARQLIQQQRPPERYLGVDLHRGMVAWCEANLTPRAPNFQFVHHDVYSYHFNPDSPFDVRPLPGEDASATLVNAISVFTHQTQNQADFYLHEIARILAPGGMFHSTWFLFDKRAFPMLQRNAAALYVDYLDPSAAVLFDHQWLRRTAAKVGLVITSFVAPSFRGYQWFVVMQHEGADIHEAPIPEDAAPLGEIRLHDVPRNASRIGL